MGLSIRKKKREEKLITKRNLISEEEKRGNVTFQSYLNSFDPSGLNKGNLETLNDPWISGSADFIFFESFSVDNFKDS